MKKYLWLVIFILMVPTMVWAQPDRFSTVQAFVAKYGLPDNANEDSRRAWTDKVAQTLAAKFPGDGWGRKRNGPGRENNPDVVAIRTAPGYPFPCVDLLRGSDGQAQWLVVNPPCSPPGEFVEVTPKDWLADEPPPVVEPPTGDPTLLTLLLQMQSKLVELEAAVKAIPPCSVPSATFPMYEGTIRIPLIGSAPVTLTPKK